MASMNSVGISHISKAIIIGLQWVHHKWLFWYLLAIVPASCLVLLGSSGLPPNAIDIIWNRYVTWIWNENLHFYFEGWFLEGDFPLKSKISWGNGHVS